jgi:hypothetical protein
LNRDALKLRIEYLTKKKEEAKAEMKKVKKKDRKSKDPLFKKMIDQVKDDDN